MIQYCIGRFLTTSWDMAEYAGQTVIFKTEDEVNEAIRHYEVETVTHFVTYVVMKSYSSTEMKVNRFRWYLTAHDDGVSVPYDRTPFCFVGKKIMCCHMGGDRSKVQKEKYQAKKKKEEEMGFKTRSRAKVQTKKKDCKAMISIKKIVKFPEYKLSEDKEAKTYAKKNTNKRLIAALNKDSEKVVKEVLFYVKFAAIEDHKGHVMGEEAAKIEPVDKRIQEHLEELADTGITSHATLQVLAYRFVENELFKDRPVPPRTRRRFYPKPKDIQNFMSRWKSKQRLQLCKTRMQQQQNNLLPTLQVVYETGDINNQDNQDQVTIEVQPPREEGEGLMTLMNTAVQEVITTDAEVEPSSGDVVAALESVGQTVPTLQQSSSEPEQIPQDFYLTQDSSERLDLPHDEPQGHEATHGEAGLIPHSTQEVGLVPDSMQEVGTSKGPRKVKRIGLVCQMKDLSHQLLDFSLLVRDQSVLRDFVGDLQKMVSKASAYAILDPAAVRRELARNRRKRQGGPPVFDGPGNKVTRLSDII